MGRCIVVLGIPRSGTSAAAGVLHNMGVDMGSGHLQPGNQFNEKGYYEDLRWQALNKKVTGSRYDLKDDISDEVRQEYERLAIKYSVKPLWGMKDPRLCVTLKYILPYLWEVKIVTVLRPLEQSVASLVNHSTKEYGGKYKMSTDSALKLLVAWYDKLQQTLDTVKCPTLYLQYRDLVQIPEITIGKLADFCFQDTNLVPSTQSALSFMEPRLWHHH
jgi:hypothetical protein